MLISMLLSTAIQVRPGSSALVYPNLKPHLGLYNVRTCAHPKKSTFVHNLLHKLTFNWKYANRTVSESLFCFKGGSVGALSVIVLLQKVLCEIFSRRLSVDTR